MADNEETTQPTEDEEAWGAGGVQTPQDIQGLAMSDRQALAMAILAVQYFIDHSQRSTAEYQEVVERLRCMQQQARLGYETSMQAFRDLDCKDEAMLRVLITRINEASRRKGCHAITITVWRRRLGVNGPVPVPHPALIHTGRKRKMPPTD